MENNGYIQGKNITYLKESKAENIDRSLQKYSEKKVNLVFTVTYLATRKAQSALKGTDIAVVGISFDPVRNGTVKSLINQKENITGIKVGGSVQKALEWLLMIAPDTKKVFVPVKFDTTAANLSLSDLKDAARKFNVDLIVSEVSNQKDLQIALSRIPTDADALFILNSIFIVNNLDSILKAATERKLPSGSGSGLFRRGVTISYGQTRTLAGTQASRLARKILEGARASSLPFETTDFFLGINLASAKAINLNIPFNIIDNSDFTIPAKTSISSHQ